MDAQQVIDLASAAGLALHPRGDTLEMVGPAGSRDALRALVAEHQYEIIDYLRNAPCRPVRSGPPAGELGKARRARAELIRLIKALAAAEGWRDETRERVLSVASRQPASTLAPDLVHFAERLRGVEAAR
ncbi:hypothetical protein CY652_10725 [Burkholderia sp. WAC0059]|uniref:hypothetical protein n=1 Tax=Burkholderia sp. WAC0059 TaxID=2066022 RepID=UPI000C7EB7BE|nr:hypothetical protein [Burkholderia sp. WAC0059]PLZ02572.1 hypothetical protein CY652_10725 [Burkholderia sp. WAC0059]